MEAFGYLVTLVVGLGIGFIITKKMNKQELENQRLQQQSEYKNQITKVSEQLAIRRVYER